jgi:hypothetical protein
LIALIIDAHPSNQVSEISNQISDYDLSSNPGKAFDFPGSVLVVSNF